MIIKTIVTHISADLDAIASCWLIKKYINGWDDADILFVSAGKTIYNQQVDSDPHIIHVDTGLGKYDHHQAISKTSASQLVFSDLIQKNCIPRKDKEALEKLISFVTEIDHFGELYFPDALDDRYDFCLNQIISGLKQTLGNDQKVFNAVFPLLDAILQVFKNKLLALKDVEKGFIFTSKWGESIIMSSHNDEAIRIAQKKGYQLVITKDKQRGFVRIKLPPKHPLLLAPLYDVIKKRDKKGTWYYHNLGHMLLNGSSKTPDTIPSPLTIQHLIEIVKSL